MNLMWSSPERYSKLFLPLNLVYGAKTMAQACPPANGSRLPKVIKTVIARGGRNDNIHVLNGSVF